MMTVGSVFSGIGGFDLGFEQAGMQVCWQIEQNTQCQSVLARHFECEVYSDVRTVESAELSPVDVICGGFPCQDVSIAGNRQGLAGERSGLWFEMLRLFIELRPAWVVIENVPGLLYSNGGRDFATVLSGLVKGGYGVAWRVLDAQYFGLAQRRKRVLIIGHRGDGRAAEVLFEPQSLSGHPAAGQTAEPNSPRRIGTLVASGAGTVRPTGQANAHDFLIPAKSYCLNAKNGKRYDGESETFLPVAQAGVRRLMPVECERLQGFPDGWTAGHSDSARYRMLGNAVAVPVAKWIGTRIATAQQEGV